MPDLSFGLSGGKASDGGLHAAANRFMLPRVQKSPVSRTLTGLRVGRVGLGRVELPTSRLSGVRSNHLSYRPRTGRNASTAGQATAHDDRRIGGRPCATGSAEPRHACRASGSSSSSSSTRRPRSPRPRGPRRRARRRRDPRRRLVVVLVLVVVVEGERSSSSNSSSSRTAAAARSASIDALPGRHDVPPPSVKSVKSLRSRRVRHPGRRPGRLLAVVRREDPLAQPDRLRRDLDQLVLLDVLQRVLQRDLPRRLQQDVLVRWPWCACW